MAEVTASPESVQSALVRRLTETMERAADALPPEAQLEALAAASPLESAALVLRGAEGPELGQPTPWIRALLRGAGLRRELATAAGGLLATGEVARMLGVTAQAVLQRRARGALLAVPTLQGDWGYPALQFGDTGVRKGIPTVLAVRPEMDPWERLAILTGSEEETPEGATLLERLDEPGATQRAIRLLESFGVHEAV